jgi:D-aspartate ligase
MKNKIQRIFRNNEEKHSAFVLGLGPQGLAFIRSLGRRGIPVYGVDYDPLNPGRWSRFGKAILLPDIDEDEEAWLEFFIEIGSNARIKPTLFPCGDIFVTFLSKYHEELEKLFLFRIPDKKVVELLCDKHIQYEYFKNTIPTPKTIFPARSANLSHYVNGQSDFPVILKPYRSYQWQKNHKEFKLEVAIDEEELKKKYELMSYHGDIMIQEVIPGDDDKLYGFISYFNRNSEPLIHFTKQKLRQNLPLYGDGTLQMSIRNEEVCELSIRVLKELSYSGHVCAEFKWDSRDKNYKLIEINPRSSSGVQMAIDSGVDIPYISYLDIIGANPEPVKEFKEGVKFINLAWDVKSFLRYRKRKQLSFFDWVKSLRGVSSYAILDLGDLKPFLFYCIALAKILIKKIVK